VALAETEKIRLKSTTMSIIKAKKHNAGYPQSYKGEEIMDFEGSTLCLRVLFNHEYDTTAWKEDEVIGFNALKNRLRFMRDGDRFTSCDVAFIASFIEQMGVLEDLDLLEWSNQPCRNPVCQHDAAAKKENKKKCEK
jgi:hypothetical protein